MYFNHVSREKVITESLVTIQFLVSISNGTDSLIVN